MSQKESKPQKPWRKILYEDQGYPDDYVDKSFLEELRKNCKLCSNVCVMMCKFCSNVILYKSYILVYY